MTADLAASRLPAHSIDAFLGGRVTLVQPLAGHRAGLDAALLQALVPAEASGHAVDLGAGVGTVTFCIAARATGLTVTGIEREADLVACARSALAKPENSGFAERVRIVQADVTAAPVERQAAGLADGSASWVLANPPFDAAGRAHPSPNAGRRAAHVAQSGLLAAWCRTAASLLSPQGYFGLIHRPDALAEILEALAGRFGGIRILPVHPSASAAASRLLVRARRGSRTPLRLLPPLILHREGGSWTDAADAVLRGRAEIPM